MRKKWIRNWLLKGVVRIYKYNPIIGNPYITIIKTTYGPVAQHKLSAFASLLLELKINNEILYTPSPLCPEFWKPWGPISGFANLIRITHQFLRSKRILFYQENGFPFMLIARILGKIFGIYYNSDVY
jgi:hypothetical protein